MIQYPWIAKQNLFQFDVEQEPMNQSRPAIVIYKFCIKGKKILPKTRKIYINEKTTKKAF